MDFSRGKKSRYRIELARERLQPYQSGLDVCSCRSCLIVQTQKNTHPREPKQTFREYFSVKHVNNRETDESGCASGLEETQFASGN